MPGLKTALSVGQHVWNHPSNRGHRGGALARAVRYQLMSRVSQRPVRATVGRSGVLLCYPRSHGASAALYANPPDYAEMLFWRRVLRPGDQFFDIGSNVGTYALWAGDCGAQVLAFEPDPGAFQRLSENIELNHFDIQARRIALADKVGTMRLTMGRDTVNQLVLDPDAGDGTQHVEVSTLDAIADDRPIRGVKIDVEGAERLVIQGAEQSLRAQRIDLIQMEWNRMSEVTLGESRAPVADLLAGHGYALFRPHPQGIKCLDSIDFGSDVFAVSPNAAESLRLD